MALEELEPVRSVDGLIAAMEAFLEAEEMNGECGWGSGVGYGLGVVLGCWEFVGEGGLAVCVRACTRSARRAYR